MGSFEQLFSQEKNSFRMDELAVYDGRTNGEMPVFDPAGKAIVINKQRDLSARGGEGFIYRVPARRNCGETNYFIKIYEINTLRDPEKMRMLSARIERMMGIIPARQVVDIKFLAWPLMKVYRDRNRQNMIGFAMYKVEGKPFCDFFVGARALQEEMPNWGRLELAKTALNYVRKINCLARKDIYVNDYNPSDFLAEDNCNVSFTDCDSFQIPDRNGAPMISHACFNAYHAPELNLVMKRDIHQVEFCVAIIVYQLLMVGLHPFQCRDPRGIVDTTDLEENMKTGRCAFIPNSDLCFPVSRGHFYDNLWNGLPDSLKECFIKTFGEGVSHPEKRASLDELENGLKDAIKPGGMSFTEVVPPRPTGDESANL